MLALDHQLICISANQLIERGATKIAKTSAVRSILCIVLISENQMIIADFQGIAHSCG
jgi:hypothetical protein